MLIDISICKGVAAEYGHKGVVQVLLEHGADATKGSTAPILDAARNGHVQVKQVEEDFS